MNHTKYFFLRSFLLLFFLIGYSCLSIGQGSPKKYKPQPLPEENFRIFKIIANEEIKAIQLKVGAWDRANNDIISTKREDWGKIKLKMSTLNGGEVDLAVEKVEDISTLSSTSTVGEATPMKVLFLLDMSGSMKTGEDKLAKAKNIIRGLVFSDKLKGKEVEFATFHNEVSVSKPLRKDNFEAVVGKVNIPDNMIKKLHTVLHKAIKQKTEELSTFEGDKVLIVLTDGEDDDRGELPKVSEKELLAHVKKLDGTYQIIPIGIGFGAKENFLKSVVRATKNENDYYKFGVSINDLKEALERVVDKLYPNVLLTFMPDPKDALFKNESRKFTLSYYADADAKTDVEVDPKMNKTSYTHSRSVVFGTTLETVDVRRIGGQDKPTSYITAIIYGVVILGLLLGGLIGLVPVFNNRFFKKKYIKKYSEVKKANVTHRDPYSTMAFNDEDEVVVMEEGGKMMLLNTWKYLREKGEGEVTKDYAEFFSIYPSGSFFSQKGVYKRLNWLWFGALGGFLAWLLHIGIAEIPFIAGDNAFRTLLSSEFDKLNDYAKPIYNQIFIGMSLGLGIVLALAIVEEYGQSRKFTIGRVLLRVLYGGVMGAFILFMESVLTTTVLHDQFLGGLVGWTIFGTALGFTVTLFSSIEMKSGLIGGLVAGIVAFLCYYGLGLLTNVLNPKTAQMMAFLIYGGVLGVIIDSVVVSLEAFELLYLSPKAFAGQRTPISKWLKSPDIDYVYIGKDPSCEIYIKWDDKMAKNKNARFSYKGNVAYIEPVEGEVLVNGTLVRKESPLNDGDKIQLGEDSVSIFQFLAKNETKEVGYTKGGKGGNTLSVRRGAPRKAPTAKSIQTRKKIIIKRRN